jgi:polysaccharide biosynthesis protein PslH
LKRLYLNHLARTLERYERKAASLFDGIAAITRKDAAFFKSLTAVPVIDLPFGIEPAELTTDAGTAKWPGLYHIGSMNWMPNEEGIRWFLDEVWPLLKKQIPGLSLTLAGRFMPPWLVSGYRSGVEVVGEVPDARQFALAHSIAIVPLLSGSGIRIKIIEAMALGKIVITTSIGAEGIHYTDKGNILIADSPPDFVEAVSFCLANPQKAAQIGQAACRLIVENYSRNALNDRLLGFYDQLKNNRENHS